MLIDQESLTSINSLDSLSPMERDELLLKSFEQKSQRDDFVLFFYFLWLFMSRIFPENIMVKLFTFMLNFSHSRRVTAATQKKAM